MYTYWQEHDAFIMGLNQELTYYEKYIKEAPDDYINDPIRFYTKRQAFYKWLELHSAIDSYNENTNSVKMKYRVPNRVPNRVPKWFTKIVRERKHYDSIDSYGNDIYKVAFTDKELMRIKKPE